MCAVRAYAYTGFTLFGVDLPKKKWAKRARSCLFFGKPKYKRERRIKCASLALVSKSLARLHNFLSSSTHLFLRCAVNHKWLIGKFIEPLYMLSRRGIVAQFCIEFQGRWYVCLINKPMTFSLTTKCECSVMSQLDISNHPHRGTMEMNAFALTLTFIATWLETALLTRKQSLWKISLSKLLHFISLTPNRLFDNNK